DARDARHRLHVAVVQAVTHVDVQALLKREVCRFLECVQLALPVGRCAGLGVARRLDLDGGGAKELRRFNLADVRIDEQRHLNPGGAQSLHRPADDLLVGDDIQPALGGQLLPAFGNQSGLVGLDPAGDFHNGIDRGQLQVQTVGHDLPQQVNVTVLDVPPVLAQVDSDAVGATEQGQDGGGGGVGFLGAAGLADGGDVVDVYPESDHG